MRKGPKSGMFPTDDEVEDLLQHMDTDGEGGIELDEFLAHMADQIELRKKVNNLTHISLTMSYERRLTQNTTSKRPFRCSTKMASEYFNHHNFNVYKLNIEVLPAFKILIQWAGAID